jgi:branched-chain amino acid transport system permease protein
MSGETSGGFASLLNPVSMPRHQQVGLLCLLAIAVAPAFIRDITVLKFTGALFFAVYVMCWDVVSGYTGEISFGHALFFGVGAYTSGILNVHFGVPLLASIPAGVLAAGAAGALIGVPSLRLQGPYFSLVTLVAPIILLSVFRFQSDLTGGELGLFGIDTISLDPLTNYYIAFGLFVAVLALFLAVTRSDAGIVLTAIREDELAVQASGLNPARYKLFAFLLSGAVGGLAGALFVHTFAQGVATPSDLLALVVSIEVIIAAILGGMGTITGAAAGGLFFYMLRDVLKNIETLAIPVPSLGTLYVEMTVPLVGKPIKEFYFLIFAVVTLAFLFVLPQGLVPWLVSRFGRSGADEDAAVADGGREATPLGHTVRKYVREIRGLLPNEGGEKR